MLVPAHPLYSSPFSAFPHYIIPPHRQFIDNRFSVLCATAPPLYIRQQACRFQVYIYFLALFPVISVFIDSFTENLVWQLLCVCSFPGKINQILESAGPPQASGSSVSVPTSLVEPRRVVLLHHEDVPRPRTDLGEYVKDVAWLVIAMPVTYFFVRNLLGRLCIVWRGGASISRQPLVVKPRRPFFMAFARDHVSG